MFEKTIYFLMVALLLKDCSYKSERDGDCLCPDVDQEYEKKCKKYTLPSSACKFIMEYRIVCWDEF